MPRFSAKQILISTTLIALGVAYVAQLQLDNYRPPNIVTALVMWIGSCAFIGAGILNLLQKPWIGALIGALVALTIIGFGLASADGR